MQFYECIVLNDGQISQIREEELSRVHYSNGKGNKIRSGKLTNKQMLTVRN